MQTIPNRATQDDFAAALTVEEDLAELLSYTVANASVIAQFKPGRRESGGRGSFSEDVLLTPSTSVVPHCSGARFKSAVAGDPAQVVAILTTPDDAQLGAGIPFNSTLLASGATIVATPNILAAGSSAQLVLSGAFQTLTGTNLGFNILGANAHILAIARFDFNIVGAGAGVCEGLFNLDGANGGGVAFFDASGGIGRSTVIGTYSAPIAAGAHNIELRANKTGGGAANAEQGSTILLLIVDA